jgi:hypothetical protein
MSLLPPDFSYNGQNVLQRLFLWIFIRIWPQIAMFLLLRPHIDNKYAVTRISQTTTAWLNNSRLSFSLGGNSLRSDDPSSGSPMSASMADLSIVSK